MEYQRPGLCRIVTTTTNGTVALQACAGASAVLVGALLNMGALVERLRRLAPARVLVICAGTFRELALEDVIAAGMLASAFPEAVLGDAAQVALAAYARCNGDMLAGLEQAKNGKKLAVDGRAEDVKWCAQVSLYPVVGVMRDGVVRGEQ